MPQPHPILYIEDLHLLYGDIKALDGITLEAKTGELTFLIGPSGSGKSSLPALLQSAGRPQFRSYSG